MATRRSWSPSPLHGGVNRSGGRVDPRFTSRATCPPTGRREPPAGGCSCLPAVSAVVPVLDKRVSREASGLSAPCAGCLGVDASCVRPVRVGMSGPPRPRFPTGGSPVALSRLRLFFAWTRPATGHWSRGEPSISLYLCVSTPVPVWWSVPCLRRLGRWPPGSPREWPRNGGCPFGLGGGALRPALTGAAGLP